MTIRKIQFGDNASLVAIIREAMSEFDANPQTTILGDPSLLTMYQNYQEPRAVYYVVEMEDKLVGGCGIRQLAGSEKTTCELQRMFLSKEARGKRIGKKLLQMCLSDAKNFGYDKVYLETLSQMHRAIMLYEKAGFKKIKKALGNTGHTGCDVDMILDI